MRSIQEGIVPIEQAPAVATRRRHQPRAVRDEEVLVAVVELLERYHAPSTSLIIWQLAGGGTVTAAFQSAVRDALQRLHAGGRLSCVTHRGTHRWSATRDGDFDTIRQAGSVK